MKSTKVLVTAAAARTGSNVVMQLIERGYTVRTLINSELHAGNACTVTGEQVLSQSDIAEIISEVTGKPVEYVDTPMEYLQKAMAFKGHPEFLNEHLSHVSEECQNVKVSDVVQKVGGRAPKSFEKYERENISEFDNQFAEVSP